MSDYKINLGTSMSILRLVTLLLALSAWHPLAHARTIPAGNYSCTGRVVKKANGQLAVFWGRGSYTFPKGEQDKLADSIGKFVKVDYVRISAQEAGIFSPVGSIIKDITKIQVLADSPDDLPVTVKVALSKQRFAYQEPIRAAITLTNKTQKDITLHLYSSTLSLGKDYLEVTPLESKTHYNDPHPYGNPDLERFQTLPAGQTLEFDIVSQRTVESGIYNLLYVLSLGPSFDLAMLSPATEIEVLKPRTKAK